MMEARNSEQENSTIDIVKFLMAILVVGIHTSPFSFNIWLDRGFGIITRLCVPFFFATSAYYFFLRERSLKSYLLRILELYVIWSLIYLPFNISGLQQMDTFSIAKRYLWDGNEHALWYLCGTVIATLIVYLLQKKLSDRCVLAITTVLLTIGCLGSTWSPAVNQTAAGGV